MSKKNKDRRTRLLRIRGRGERELEAALKARGFVVEVQKPILGYFADLALPELRRVVEVDGRAHKSTQRYDAYRTERIESEGWSVYRVSSRYAQNHPESVTDDILAMGVYTPGPVAHAPQEMVVCAVAPKRKFVAWKRRGV